MGASLKIRVSIAKTLTNDGQGYLLGLCRAHVAGTIGRLWRRLPGGG